MSGNGTFPNPLEIKLGEGTVEVHDFSDDDGRCGILFRDTKEAHLVGDIPAPLESPHPPEPGEIYLSFGNMGSAIVVLDALTACIRRLAGFPEAPAAPERRKP